MDDIDVPNLTEQELWEYLRYDLGIPISRRAVKHAVFNRELVPARLGAKNLFSRSDAHAWIEFRRQPEPGRPIRNRDKVSAAATSQHAQIGS